MSQIYTMYKVNVNPLNRYNVTLSQVQSNIEKSVEVNTRHQCPGFDIVDMSISSSLHTSFHPLSSGFSASNCLYAYSFVLSATNSVMIFPLSSSFIRPMTLFFPMGGTCLPFDVLTCITFVYCHYLLLNVKELTMVFWFLDPHLDPLLIDMFLLPGTFLNKLI